jgi:hypothetical protein
MQVTLHVESPHWGQLSTRLGTVRLPLLRALWHRRRLRRAGWTVRLTRG